MVQIHYGNVVHVKNTFQDRAKSKFYQIKKAQLVEIEKPDTKKPIQEMDAVMWEFMNLVSMFSDEEINKSPNATSWTAAQLAEHITLANRNLALQLSKKGKVCERQPDAGVEKLRSIFLDFTKKLKSPDFILPTRNYYRKDDVTGDLKKSAHGLEAAFNTENLFEVIDHPIFGEVTRLEMVYFVIYHTRRHVHQLREIQQKVQAEKHFL